MNRDVAVIIVTYNSERQIEACLRSLIEQRRSLRQQIVVLDNQSSDQTVELVRRKFPEVELVTPGRNLGFAAGVNLAARQADAEFILLLNPDTVVLDGAVDEIVSFARANPGYGLYGGRTLSQDGRLEPSSCWGLPSLWSLAMFATGASTAAKRNRFLDPESLGNWQRDTVREVGVITGCFLLVDRTAWQRLGGFDERFFMYGEDTDLAMRARGLGYRPVICPRARLVHEVGQSSSTPLQKARLLYRGKATFVRTHWQGLSRWAGLTLLTLGVGARAFGGWVRSLSGRPLNPTWAGLWKERRGWLEGYPSCSQSSGPAGLVALPYPERR